MIQFRQLFDPTSATYTYLLADPVSRQAVLIDPVREQVERDLDVLEEMGVTLTTILETHVHADHITGAGELRRRTGARVAVGRECGADCADRQLDDGDRVVFGDEVIEAIATPGHTSGSMTYRWRDRLFTGDTLLIGACGRTDFQAGDAGTLWDSLQRLLALPGETLVYPGHDYNGRTVSSLAEEAATNPRITRQTRDSFIALMNGLDLDKPRRIDEAVPANRRCGLEQAA